MSLDAPTHDGQPLDKERDEVLAFLQANGLLVWQYPAFGRLVTPSPAPPWLTMTIADIAAGKPIVAHSYTGELDLWRDARAKVRDHLTSKEKRRAVGL